MGDKKQQGIKYPFWFGGASSMWAAVFTHPLDLNKVRLQTAKKVGNGPKPGMVDTFRTIFRNEGFLGLYSGLTASLLRQATYSTTRFGIYEELKGMVKKPNKELPLPTLIALSSTSGFLGSIAGNPADIINVRMQQDGALEPSKRRNYKNAIDGIIKMVKSEGITSLFRGVGPNSGRGALMTASQLASYDEFKMLLLGTGMFEDNLMTHFVASTMAGGVATLICSPVDVVKTKIMSSHDPDGIIHLLKETTKREGMTWAFKGLLPSFIRLGPHTVLTFVFLEQHKSIWKAIYTPQEERLS
ncbi:Mitochondrial dicarboxylate transporter [Orbilia oligospora]|uniref:Mitochondrial dicarboxylate transporter n=1 Tax=Orbilia oligospora TaxID=2813651 RepID=A0A6G1M4V0_ORBOL|nr:Mitochondrial dicarboxylate transporter [Orbilia oligospora]KAF3217610.1 Mitochondrial dicarboxylate transporter [Orbilia oligospora]KAF3245807.1 Mitochondrial dicarboxylate transporter [Orbilia oligospora]